MISVRLLARPDAKVAAVIGVGVQGQSHAKMLAELGCFEKIFISGSHERRATTRLTRGELIHFTPSIAQAAAEADVICLCTSATGPVLKSSWPKTGVHISSVGYNPPGSELGRELAGSGQLFVESPARFRANAIRLRRIAGAGSAVRHGTRRSVARSAPGRLSPDERTIYKSMGHAMEDSVAANLVYRLARQRGVGKEIRLV